MANFPKSPPAIGRSTGLQGLQGATGAAGAGTISGVVAVDSLSGTPRSVTDWEPLIAAAITGGARHFMFGPYDYPYSTPFVIGVQNVTFEGAGGVYWNPPSGANFSRLIYTGAGSGVALDASTVDTQYFQLRNLALCWNNVAFTGTVFKGKAFMLDTVTIYSTGLTQTTSADLHVFACINAGNAVGCHANRVILDNAINLVVGEVNGVDTFSNTVRFRDTVFQGHCTNQVLNPGLDWLIDHPTHELVGFVQNCYTTDHNMGNGGSWQVKSPQFWDSDHTGVTFFNQPASHSWVLAVMDATDHNAADATMAFGNFQGNGTIILRGGGTIHTTDFGDVVASATHKKDLIAVEGFSAADGTLLHLNTGHREVDVGAVATTTSSAHITGIHTVSHERINNLGSGFSQFSPVVTFPYAAGTLSVFDSLIGDAAGWIQIRNGGGGATSTGKIADFTFFENFVSSNNGFPMVLLSPYVGRNPATGTSDNFWTCKPYALGGVAAAQKWTLGIEVALPAGQVLGFGYRVIYL